MEITDAMRPAAALLLLAPFVFAGQTRTWTQSDYSEFQKGTIRNLSVRSDGMLTVAPKVNERYDSSSAYLWGAALDSKGNLYVGGGPGAKVYRVGADGKNTVVAEMEGLQVQSIAIDKSDRVYAATNPDGKVYRVTNGKAEVFYDPKTKYIWGLTFDSKGNLYVATGDGGEVHRVARDGKGSLFFKTQETHARSIAVDANDNLIVGTEPSGLIIRVGTTGQGFVLYQLGKKEVTAVAVHDGIVYAAGVGNKSSSVSSSSLSISTAPPPQPTGTQGSGGGSASETAHRIASQPTQQQVPPVPSVSGGSEVYRIEANGNPHRAWTSTQDLVYAIGFDGSGKALLGTGNKGMVYRLDSDTLYTALVNVPPTQITAFADRGGKLFAVTGNVGKVYQIGPGNEESGTIESDVLDTAMFTHWGRLTYEGTGNVSIVARSGNVDQPLKNWSSWSNVVTTNKGARLNMPAARFAQWKATLTADAVLRQVDLAYQQRNTPPRVEEIEVTAANYKFPAPSTMAPGIAPATLTLPALGRKTTSGGSSTVALDTGSSGSTNTLTYSKGWIGARWLASDENGDTLIYTLQIRGVQEKEWKVVREKIREKYYSWDSTTFPDGEYKVRVIASDSPSNPPNEALTAELVSDTLIVDNTPPRVGAVTAQKSGGSIELRWHAADALNNLKRAEYSLDGGDWTVVAPVGGISDSQELDYSVRIGGVGAGEHTIAIRVSDEYDNYATEKTVVR